MIHSLQLAPFKITYLRTYLMPDFWQFELKLHAYSEIAVREKVTIKLSSCCYCSSTIDILV